MNRLVRWIAGAWLVGLVALLSNGCTGGGDGGTLSAQVGGSCMQCHNGSLGGNYGGPGIENPHPFPGAENISCDGCHGGNPAGDDKDSSHVPPPPQIGDRAFQANNRYAFFNNLTLTGIDKLPNYTVNGRTYTALDYLQFENPGDLRIVEQGRGCGSCHSNHGEVVNGSILATSAGIFSGAKYSIGADSDVSESVGLYEHTAADLGFRPVTDANSAMQRIGDVLRLLEVPVYSGFNDTGPDAIRNNDAYLAAELNADVLGDGRVVSDSELEHLMTEQFSFTCGDCHLGSRGANNRSGDYRSSGCSSCHMPYSLGGRSGSADPNINKFEPLDPDDIDPGEMPHLRSHRIVSVNKTLPNGAQLAGMDDYTCAGCHQGSNRTVMQFWGIRLDQNQDVRFGNQYPAQPVSSVDTRNDPRLFDAVVGNNEFNGRNGRQYLRFEDYDGDSRDDTPADVHYEAGMGCIDCHNSYDLHGGKVSDPANASIASRMEQSVGIRCESCHGQPGTYAQTVAGTRPDGSPGQLGVDAEGNVLDHVYIGDDGNYWMRSKLTGATHFISQTRDTIANTGAINPQSGQPVYSPRASYAMGRADGNPNTGIGPMQTAGVPHGFTHTENMNCVSCHASWTNTCMGCHLEGEYNTGNNFSNITGERIVFNEEEAQFVYQSPIPFQLGVGPRGKITQISSNTKMFFRWKDRQNTRSDVFAFSDRNSNGNDPSKAFAALGHNAMMAHSIRGKVSSTNEGPRYCSACHLTTDSINNYGGQYDQFRTAMAAGDWGSLNFDLLQEHIGQNPGNQLDSPLWVHMAAGLGSGLYLFDANGAAVNPLDDNANRYGTDGIAPSANFDPARVAFVLDRLVEPTGQANSSSTHMQLEGPNGLRLGALNPNLAGPLGADLVQKLTDPNVGIVLDSWLDANGDPHGDAFDFMYP